MTLPSIMIKTLVSLNSLNLSFFSVVSLMIYAQIEQVVEFGMNAERMGIVGMAVVVSAFFIWKNNQLEKRLTEVHNMDIASKEKIIEAARTEKEAIQKKYDDLEKRHNDLLEKIAFSK